MSVSEGNARPTAALGLLRSADIAAFTLVLLASIWVVQPLTGSHRVFTWTTVSGVAIAVFAVLRARYGLARLGLRIDNLLPALGAYLPLSSLYAVAAILLCGGFQPRPAPHSWYGSIPWGLLWSFLQEFCLLGFLLNRFLDLFDTRRTAALSATLLFAAMHLPNPFLTLYTIGGGLVVTFLFLRLPNLFAATLAHALASLLVSRFLPVSVTGGMKVGSLYWIPPWGR